MGISALVVLLICVTTIACSKYKHCLFVFSGTLSNSQLICQNASPFRVLKAALSKYGKAIKNIKAERYTKLKFRAKKTDLFVVKN